MELTDILTFEVANRCHIYLYLHKGMVWSCYERSALLLHRIYTNIPYWERDVSGKGVVVPVMIIDLLTLEHLIENVPPIERDTDRIVIKLLEELRLL